MNPPLRELEAAAARPGPQGLALFGDCGVVSAERGIV